MNRSMLGKKIAVLVASGFNEADLVLLQKTLQSAGATLRLIGMDHGLVNGWEGAGWGQHFASDQAMNSALVSDFCALVIPGGARSISKLKLTEHTRRLLNGFIEADKPVLLLEEAVELLGFAGCAEGRVVAGPKKSCAEAAKAGAKISAENLCADGQLFTATTSGFQRPTTIRAAAQFLAGHNIMEEAA